MKDDECLPIHKSAHIIIFCKLTVKYYVYTIMSFFKYCKRLKLWLNFELFG
ncbi:hypothetical protein PLUTE_a3842 [Pseudoalteromonas luteoviolacea DSM 6061]|nr:hypothetical protein [Pseudoalteromonas luteoviolacea DSM 6061]